MVTRSGPSLLIFTPHQIYVMYFSGVIMGRVLSLGMLVKCVCSAVRPCVCFFFFPSLNFRSGEWFCIKEFPPWWPKLDFLFLPPQKCSASPGWEDNSPPGACHVDRAAQLQCPQDMFFFSVSLPVIYLSAYFTPITTSVRGDTVSDWTLICPKDDIIPFLSLLVSATPPSILFTALRRGARVKQFFFHVSRI